MKCLFHRRYFLSQMTIYFKLTSPGFSVSNNSLLVIYNRGSPTLSFEAEESGLVSFEPGSSH